MCVEGRGTEGKGECAEKTSIDVKLIDMKDKSGDPERSKRQGNAPNILPSGYLFSLKTLALWEHLYSSMCN